MSDKLLARAGDTVAIASDHAGVALKAALKNDLAALGYKVLDLGPATTDSVDYPDFGHALAKTISDGKAKAGVAICGSGIGISIAVNRHAHMRAALVHDAETAALTRRHNDANVLALGARTMTADTARDIAKAFFATEFEGGRHARRVEKLG
ncbi:MAG: ribose 5-phosphate isomerase B [Rhodospirillaceae bacterium]|nr:ribose 5-phosphate isomerase B [Rhodospirillaceae bacterium]